jgi:hypothetical protein
MAQCCRTMGRADEAAKLDARAAAIRAKADAAPPPQ